MRWAQYDGIIIYEYAKKIPAISNELALILVDQAYQEICLIEKRKG